MKQQEDIVIDKYRVLKQIGVGAFSYVYKCIHTQTGVLYALKKIKYAAATLKQKELSLIRNEIQILRKVNHPNIIKMADQFCDRGKWYMAFEYCGLGDLKQLLGKSDNFDEFTCQVIAYKIASALQHLHINKIAHRDLKLPNILVDQNFEIKLADLGLSKSSSQEDLMKTYCGSPLTMAPQILYNKGQAYDLNCDTYSFGVVVYQMIYRQMPFNGKNEEDLRKNVQSQQVIFHESTPVSDECKRFLSVCLEKDKLKRPQIQVLMESDPWLKGGRTISPSLNRIIRPQVSLQLVNMLKADLGSVFRYFFEAQVDQLLRKSGMLSFKDTVQGIQECFGTNSELSKLISLLFAYKMKTLNETPIVLRYAGGERHVTIEAKHSKNYLYKQSLVLASIKQHIESRNFNYSSIQNLQRTAMLIVMNQFQAVIKKQKDSEDAQIALKKLGYLQAVVRLYDKKVAQCVYNIKISKNLESKHKAILEQSLKCLDERDILGSLNRLPQEELGSRIEEVFQTGESVADNHAESDWLSQQWAPLDRSIEIKKKCLSH